MERLKKKKQKQESTNAVTDNNIWVFTCLLNIQFKIFNIQFKIVDSPSYKSIGNIAFTIGLPAFVTVLFIGHLVHALMHSAMNFPVSLRTCLQ